MNQLSKTFTVRLPEMAIREMEAVAKSQYMPTRTMIRAWIMQRLEAEKKPAMGAVLGGTTPIASSTSDDASASTRRSGVTLDQTHIGVGADA